jgi:hypothetical protein
MNMAILVSAWLGSNPPPSGAKADEAARYRPTYIGDDWASRVDEI